MTISDVEALLVKLHKAYRPEDIVLHAGTAIDSPNDLRTVTDRDLRTLSITVMSDSGKTPWGGRAAPDMTEDDLVVMLRIDEAAAVGIEPLVYMVEDWARTRQFTGLPPRLVLRRTRKSIWNWRVVVTFFILAQVSSWLGVILYESTASRAISAGYGILGLILLAWLTYRRFTEPQRVDNFALVIPMTLEEYRKEEVVRKRYYITTAIAIGAPSRRLLPLL